jgi:hypothetical protein
LHGALGAFGALVVATLSLGFEQPKMIRIAEAEIIDKKILDFVEKRLCRGFTILPINEFRPIVVPSEVLG